ncbi:MAG: UbiA family prenyltransferase [Candidatus Bathyarchaeota archaeon]|nr:UbiA family prenyltransferase [Candidatus Bathyarchaeota archaeon]
MNQRLKAYFDLTRLHFFFVWPTLFCAGLFLVYQTYGGFSTITVLQAVLIGFFGFEAGLILNDIVDAQVDKKELASDNRLTKYWRPFGKRPIPSGLISRQKATIFFAALVTLTTIVIFTLPVSHAVYVFAMMLVCYCLEAFYQLKKRKEKIPVAQVIGRIDFALFLVAGYLVVGKPDFIAVLLFLFFYPLALAHLGVNDLVDVANDKAKGMNTIPILYSMNTTAYWILGFSILHFVVAAVFLYALGSIWMLAGFAVSFVLISGSSLLILQKRSAEAAIKALPLFHVSMLIYALSIIASYLIGSFK